MRKFQKSLAICFCLCYNTQGYGGIAQLVRVHA